MTTANPVTTTANPIDELRAQVEKMLDGLNQRLPISATMVFKVKKDKKETLIRKTDSKLVRTWCNLPAS
jgi:hypothetical protein